MKRIACALAIIACALGGAAASGAKAALPFSQSGLVKDLAYDQYGPTSYAVSIELPIFGFGGYTNLTDQSRTFGSYAYTPEQVAFSFQIDGIITNIDRLDIIDEYWSDDDIYDSSGHLIGFAGGSDYLINDPANNFPIKFDGKSIDATIVARETSTVSTYSQQSYRPLYLLLEFEVDADPGATYSISAVSVPEPATWAMMVLGLVGVGAALRSNRMKARLA